MHAIHCIFYSLHIFAHGKSRCELQNVNFAQTKYTKIPYHGIPSIGINVLEFFCVPLYIELLFDLYEKFQILSVYDTNVEYQILCFCYNLFLGYADNRHTDTHTQTHRPFAKNVIFGFRGAQNV